jgi:hypothetical protein
LSHRKAILILLLLFIVSRFFLFTGFPFSMNFLDIGMQMLDPADMKGDLLNALFYQHTEPPLFNALVGIALKIVPDSIPLRLFFAVLYGFIGLILVLGIYRLALDLGASRGWSLTAAGLFTFWPPVIFEQIFHHPPPEKWLSYDYPVMALLLLMALALGRFNRNARSVWITVFLFLSAALVLMRPFFHPFLWFLPLAALAIRMGRAAVPKGKLIVLAASLIALLLASAPSVKNLILFNWFTGSSFQGMNLASRALFLSRDKVLKEVEKGQVTQLALVPRFSEPEVYLRYYGDNQLTGNRFLDRIKKSTGQPNWNHLITIRTSREYEANTFALLRAYPLELVRTFLNGMYIFFGFESHQFLWPLGSAPWGFWDVAYPEVRIHGVAGFSRYVLGPLFFAFAYIAILAGLFKRRDDPLRLFLVYSLVYVFIVSNMLELGHNAILRKQIDPYLFAGGAMWLTDFLPSGYRLPFMKANCGTRLQGGLLK